VAGLLPVVDAHAPWLLQLEFSNVLRSACRRGTIEIAAAREIVDQVALLPIRNDAALPQPAALLSLALRFQLTSYDAAYLGPPEKGKPTAAQLVSAIETR